MTHKFFMPMIPPTITAQQKKINFKTKALYDPPQLAQAKEKLKAHLASHVPQKMFTGPTRLIVRWLFPIKGKNLYQNGQYKTTKPDTDNLNKAFKDILEKLKFVKNDAIICSELIEKFWADTPGIYVELQEIYQELPTKKGR